MRTNIILRSALAVAVLGVSGCLVAGSGVTVTGAVRGSYADIVSDVTVTVTDGPASATATVALVGNFYQAGSYLVADVPPGSYSVTVVFDADLPALYTAEYQVNGGGWIQVDDVTRTGSASPYTFTVTVDSVSVSTDTTIDLWFADNL